MMFLSGSALPFFLLPGWVQHAARLLPATYLNEGLQRVMISGQATWELAGPIAVLLVFGAIGLVLNSLLLKVAQRRKKFSVVLGIGTRAKAIHSMRRLPSRTSLVPCSSMA